MKLDTPEKRARHNAKTLAHYHANRERLRVERREAARDKQIAIAGYAPDRCEICGRASDRAVHFDHNHHTGKFRGWLCGSCNKGLGLFGDNPGHLEAAAVYLRQRGYKP